MAIEKFLAMENGEPGYAKAGTVTHVPFPSGGNGVQIASNSNNLWAQGNSVIVPFGNAADIRIEFTSLGYWAITSIGANGAIQASAEFIAGGIRTQYENYGGAGGTWVEPNSITAQPHRWGVRFVGGNPGRIEVWCDGARMVNREMKTTGGSSSAVMSALRLSASPPNGSIATFDSVVTGDEWLGDCHVDYLVPDGNGDTNEWLGSDSDSVDNYLLVNEVPPSGVQYVEADGEDLLDLYTVTNLPASGQILAVEQVISAWKAGPNPQHPLNYVLKTPGGTDVEQGPELIASMRNYTGGIKLLNPEGNPWTVADVNNLQIGVTSEAL